MLPYGHTQLPLPPGLNADWIEPAFVTAAADPLGVVRAALQNPVDGVPLEAYAGARSVAIAVNDKTRPVPHEHLLPPLLDALEGLGFTPGQITFFIATGTHLPMKPEEYNRILPDEILRRYRVVSHDIDDEANIVRLGVTSRGTEVSLNRAYYESGLKIVVGNIEPHHFAGYSGGYKTAAIGLGGRAGINHNHAMLVEPESTIASYARNPLRQDIEEMGAFTGVQFALNAVLNSELKIVHAVAGGPLAVMAAGIPLSARVCQVPSRGKYDLVIASVGGAPKDINFYQSQKALTHSSLFTREGGVIILVAECPEGSGDRGYEQIMEGVTSIGEVYARFKLMGFRVGPHKAFQVARIAEHARIILLSAIDPGLVSRLLMLPAASLDDAVSRALALLGPNPRVAVLPHATNTVPVMA